MATSTLPASPTLVNIGTHSLALYAHGPEPSSSADSVVLFVSGVASSATNWAAVVRLLPANLRSYTYDRSGNRNSDLSPREPSAENVALELSLLIKHAPISNPLVIVGHSWAGVIISEFLALTGNDSHIAGLVLVDANHETALQVLDVNDPNLFAVIDGVEQYSGCGVEAEHKLTKEEYAAFQEDQATDKFKAIEQKEDFEQYVPSFVTLRKKELSKKQPLLGSKPLYIIGGMRSRDYKNLYNAGVTKGNGTEEQRRLAREFISTADQKNEILMHKLKELSTTNTVMMAQKSGHFVQMTEPEIVVNGVKWVQNELQKSS